MKIRFFNTFRTVSPHFRQLLPLLGSRGHDVEAVLAGRPYRPGEPESDGDGFRVHAMPVWKRRELRSRADKLALYASYAASAGTFSLLGSRADLNVFFTQPPLFSAWGRALEIMRRQPYVQIIMDLYPWLAVQVGALAPGGWLARVAAAVARRALRGSSRVVVIGRCMRRRVEELGVEPNRVRLIRSWADCDLVRPVPRERNRLRRAHGLDDRFVVMYSGNLGLTQSFSDLLEAAGRLRERRHVVFLIVGDGVRRGEIEAAVRDRGLDNCRLLEFQRHVDLAESLCMGDVHYVSLRQGLEGLAVPSKAYNAMAAGRAIIYQGAGTGEIALTVKEEEVGWLVEPGDAHGLEQAILDAAEDHDGLRRKSIRARAAAEAHYDGQRGLADFEALFRELSREISD